MAEPTLIYKITVLRLLSTAKSPLSNGQISQFFLDKEYTDYFSAQQVISDLEDSNLIVANATHNTTLYTLTPEGATTLDLMRDKLTSAIEDDILSYLKENNLEFQTDNSLSANYDKATGGGYIVHCKYIQNKQLMLEVNLHAGTLQQAETICNNWKARHEDVYMSLMDTLI